MENLCDAGVNDSGRPSCASVVCDPGAMIKMCSSRNGGILNWAGPRCSTTVVIELSEKNRAFTKWVVSERPLNFDRREIEGG